MWLGRITALANRFPNPEYLGETPSTQPRFLRDSQGEKGCSPPRESAVVRPPASTFQPVPGDLSACPRWAAIWEGIRSKEGRATALPSHSEERGFADRVTALISGPKKFELQSMSAGGRCK